jgi:hypothetical protein
VSRRSQYRLAALTAHRLHRGGDRQANSGPWRIALVRMGCHQPTKDYVARRTAEGKTKTEIMRCLKRYIAREVFPHLLMIQVHPHSGAPSSRSQLRGPLTTRPVS